MTPCTRRSALATALLLALQAPAFAQDASPQTAPANDTATKELDTVTVTGSRIKRSTVEGPAPVNIISSDQMRREGFQTVKDALGSMTEFTGTVPAGVNKGATPNAAPLNLRNLGPGRTLLLIDGRRVADYPLPFEGRGNFANFNNIPIAMVDRIEVLASGGSAIYGSDAMAGVINVILKKNLDTNEFRAKAGTTTRGGGESYDFSWVGGVTGEQWNVTYGMQYSKSKTLFAGDRPFMDSDYEPAPTVQVRNAPPWIWGVELYRNDLGTLPMRITPPEGACDRFQDLPLHHFVVYDGQSGQDVDTGYSCTQGKGNALWSIRNGHDNFSAYGNGSYDLANGMQLWASASFWNAKGESRQDEAMRFSLLGKSGGTWYDPQFGATMSGRRAFTVPEAGGHGYYMFNTRENAWDLAGGVRGRLGERFDWDLTLGRAEYEISFDFPAFLQSAVDDYFLGPQLGTTADGLPIHALNQERFWNPMSIADFNGMTTRGGTRAQSWMNQAQFALNGDLFELPAGPVGFAAVLEGGTQGYRLEPDRNTLGDNRLYEYPGTNPGEGGGSRDRYAAGVEFKAPLLSSLTLTAAGRYDRYVERETERGAFTWNAGLEWRPLSNLLIRGAYNTTFRAPDMHYLYATSGLGFSDDVDSANCIELGTNPQCSAQALYYRHGYSRSGNPDLKNESGRAWSAGFVWDATDRFSLSVDYWDMTVTNQISDLGVGTVVAYESGCRHGINPDGSQFTTLVPGSSACQEMISRVTRSAPGTDASGAANSTFPLGQIQDVVVGPINLARREVAGVDVAANYRLPTSVGDFHLSANYTNQLAVRNQADPGSPLVDSRDDDIRSFARASIGWERGPYSATLFARRTGHVNGDAYNQCVPVPEGQPAPDPETCPRVGKLKAPIYYNLALGYAMNPQSRVNLYVENLLDDAEYKDPYKMFFQYANERVYDRVGREVFLEYVHTFK